MIIKITIFDLCNILIDIENILIYNISYKTLMGAKPLRIRFDKINGFIRVYDGTRYLVLFGGEKYNFIYNRMSYKSKNTYVISYNYAKIKDDSYTLRNT